ncbi:MAG: hypothetical protein ACLSUW_09600 [Akkermansia sp.]
MAPLPTGSLKTRWELPADAAAAMIQSVSGETVVNAAWASNDALKGFASLVRTQGALSAAQGLNSPAARPMQAVDAKGSPIAMAPVASGRGSVWVGGLGSWTDQNARHGIDGYKYDAGGHAVGADFKLSFRPGGGGRRPVFRHFPGQGRLLQL